MIKIAVLGANTFIGRELVNALEHFECSVLPLHCEETASGLDNYDEVLFAPDQALLKNIDVVIVVKKHKSNLLSDYTGRILYIDDNDGNCDNSADISNTGLWPDNKQILQIKSVLYQILTVAKDIVHNVDFLNGVYLQSVAHLGDDGVHGLMSQSVDILNGNEPKLEKLGYRAAFEVIPSLPINNITYVKTPTFHGDILILHLIAKDGKQLKLVNNNTHNIKWCDRPPTSREVATSANILANFTLLNNNHTAVLTLGFDPILWGIISPIVKLLGV